jgi:hypothetical protein
VSALARRMWTLFGNEDRPPAGLEIRRTRAGHHQRSNGAWSWYLYAPDQYLEDLGSQWPARELWARRGEIEVRQSAYGVSLHVRGVA